MRSDLPSQPPDDAPDALKRAWPLVVRWGESDDVEREHLLDSATEKELTALIEAVKPLFPAINGYLDETGDAEHAVPYGDLAQAAMEAQLDRRNRTSGSTRWYRSSRICRSSP